MRVIHEPLVTRTLVAADVPALHASHDDAGDDLVVSRAHRRCDPAADDVMTAALSRGFVWWRRVLGNGLTRPHKVWLSSGVRAVRKPNNPDFGSDAAAEVAAFRMDRMLDLGLVPVTVLRSQGNRLFSFQHFIAGSRDFRALGRDPDQLLELRFFDFLIGNYDRNPGNVLASPNEALYAIDHGLAFDTRATIPNELDIDRTVPPLHIRRRIVALKPDRVRADLGGLLSEARITAVLARRQRLLAAWQSMGLR